MNPTEVQAAVARAVSTTRRSIAQALHDDLQQHLHGLEVRVAHLEAQVSAGAGVEAEALSDLRDRVHTAVGVLRSVTTELARERAETLVARLRRLIAELSGLHDLDVDHAADLAVDGSECEPARSVADVVVDSARELLFNVVKHAGVTHAKVRVSVDADEVVLVVSDAGRGFGGSETEATGLGLDVVRQRVAALGGSVARETPPMGGTTMVVSIPNRPLTQGAAQPEETAALT